MANLSLRHVCKIYPARGGAKKSIFNFKKKNTQSEVRVGDFTAVKDFNMEIEDGEFIVFVGPSGCGKSTTLRMIAGLEDISAGEMYIDGKLVNNVDAKDRDIAMVFQSYALYPHMTSYENIAFGLKLRKIPVPKTDKEGNPVIAIDNKKIKELQKTVKSLEAELSCQEECGISKLFTVRIDALKKELATAKSAEQVDEAAVTDIKEKINALKLAQKAAVKAHRNPTEEAKEQAVKQAEEVGVDITNIADNEIKAGLRQRIQSTQDDIKYCSETPVQIYVYKHMAKEVIDEKVQWAAGILGIKELLQSKPSDMSGGQRQRIALGRAMVRGPKVFLLDEPLSNLDAKLRTTMRSEIVKLHKELKTTFIYVTHDQVEAMTMGSRIVVMKDGYVQQIDTPTNLFDYPENKFVAGFIGTPQMNFFRVRITKKAKSLVAEFANGEELKLSLAKLRPVAEEYLDGNPHEVYLGVRGEHVNVGASGISVNVNLTEILGSDMHVFFRIDGEDGEFIACINGRIPLNTDDKLHFSFDESKVHMFDIETEKSILGKAE